jgi:hypothetical protein
MGRTRAVRYHLPPAVQCALHWLPRTTHSRWHLQSANVAAKRVASVLRIRKMPAAYSEGDCSCISSVPTHKMDVSVSNYAENHFLILQSLTTLSFWTIMNTVLPVTATYKRYTHQTEQVKASLNRLQTKILYMHVYKWSQLNSCVQIKILSNFTRNSTSNWTTPIIAWA